MPDITVIAVGSLQQKHYRDAADEYIKRLGAHYRVFEIEIKEERLPASPTEADIAKGLEKEAERISAAIPKRAFVTALCIEGKTPDSAEFSNIIEQAAVRGYSSFAFIVGSSHGLSEKIKKTADLRLSMSRMTFPHQLARVMLYEALYRADEIRCGTRYHK